MPSLTVPMNSNIKMKNSDKIYMIVYFNNFDNENNNEQFFQFRKYIEDSGIVLYNLIHRLW